MELKDVILSTLAEMEEEIPKEAINNISASFEIKETKTVEKFTPKVEKEVSIITSSGIDSEARYLSSIRERLLVLFEGFQAPNNKDIEAKVDMTLNFLEYVLATIDSHLEKIDQGKAKWVYIVF